MVVRYSNRDFVPLCRIASHVHLTSLSFAYVCPSTGIGLYASSRYWISSPDNFTSTPASIDHQIMEFATLVGVKRTNDVAEVSETSSTDNWSTNAYSA